MKTEIIKRSKVVAHEIEEMYNLHRLYFENISRENFWNDFNDKDFVIRLFNGDSPELLGFSTVKVISFPVNGKHATFIFSGDTVMDKTAWNNNGKLAGAFGNLLLKMTEEHRDVYWFLISKGCRTYRFLPVFFNSFFPDPLHMEKSAKYKPLLDEVAFYYFGNYYDTKKSIISYDIRKDYLRTGLVDVPETRKEDPYISYFLENNPNFMNGDELACLAPVTRENFRAAAWRVIKNTEVEWYE